MPEPKREHPKEKAGLHPRNKHRDRYNFGELTKSCPELTPFVKPNNFGDLSVDFFNPAAVKAINKALLKHFYGIGFWDIPAGYLCPPIPSRADYLHHMADLLASQNKSAKGTTIPLGPTIKCLDVGVGANCVYPIIGAAEYGWSFIGSDIDPVALAAAAQIIEKNAVLNGLVELRLQKNPNAIFQGILRVGERIDLSICNPPFHNSAAEAQAGSVRKLRNLTQKKITKPSLNFGGQHNELWCRGGETAFVTTMIEESKAFAASCFWFSSLISKEANLTSAYKTLKTVGAAEVVTLPMSQGNKISRIIAWTFLSPTEQQNWVKSRWQ